MADDDMMVDVDIPVDIEGAVGPDGIPIVVPAAKTTAGPRRKAALSTPAPGSVPQEEFDAVRRDRDAAQAARVKAEQIARDAAGRLLDTTGRLHDTTVQAYGAHYARVNGELQQITTAIASTEALADSAERELAAANAALAAAMEPAERADAAARQAKAQRELSRAEAELVTLGSGKASAEAAVATAKQYYEHAADTVAAAARTPPPEPKTKDADAPAQMTADQWIDSCPSATRPWLREHRQFTTDDKLHRKLRRFADDYADDHGQGALDSADFVAALNAKFFPKQEETVENQEDDEPAKVEPQRTRTTAAAPVSRGSTPGAPNGSAGGKIRLSADEQTTAIAMYPDMDRAAALKRYATNKARAIADGRYAPRQ